MNFTVYWRFECVKIAAMEQLDIMGYLDGDKLFIRAKEIYDKGLEEGIEKWNSMWEGDPNELAFKPGIIKNTIIKPPPKKEDKGKKICPKCGEEVPIGWKKHAYTLYGDVCGYEFDK